MTKENSDSEAGCNDTLQRLLFLSRNVKERNNTRSLTHLSWAFK